MCKISIARIYYPVKVLGPGERIGIWMTGCDRGCRGCISPELQEYDSGREIGPEDVAAIIEKVIAYMQDSSGIGFTISGGEPFYRPEALRSLLEVCSRYSDDIIVFTGYTIEELRAMNDPDISEALKYISVLIDGPFEADKRECRGLRGSANQRIHILRDGQELSLSDRPDANDPDKELTEKYTEKYRERYRNLEGCETELQPVVYGDSLLMIGIPRE